MNESLKRSPELVQIDRESAVWFVRRERGLGPTEQDEFSQWLAVDERHRESFARQRSNWDRLGHLANKWRPEHSSYPNPDLLAPPFHGRRWVLPVALAAAAIAVLGIFLAHPHTPPTQSFAPPTGQGVERRVLDDGSVVEVDRGAMLLVQFTQAERHVRLVRGQAHFTVTKNPVRPFIVSAEGIDVCAVGTAFNVRLDSAAVEVNVTEGRVRVDSAATTGANPRAAAALATVDAGERAIVSLHQQAPAPQVTVYSRDETRKPLTWRDGMLDFTRAPLSDVVLEFNRRNSVRLVIADADLAVMPVTVSFRPDNVDGFVRSLESGFGVDAEYRGDEIVLRFRK